MPNQDIVNTGGFAGLSKGKAREGQGQRGQREINARESTALKWSKSSLGISWVPDLWWSHGPVIVGVHEEGVL